MDRLYIDGNGDLASCGTTEIPQPAPGRQPEAAAHYYPLSVRKAVHATSELPGRECINATEENLFCRWVPSPEDSRPVLTVELKREYTLRSARVIFSDEGLDYSAGKCPSPRRYVIEGRDFVTKEWVVLADCSDNTTEYMIQYHEFPEEKEMVADAVRLTLFPDPCACVGTGVRNFTVFGTP